MAKSSSPSFGTFAAAVFTAYHVITLISDAEAWMQNLRAYRARPTGNNLVRLLVAEGVFLKDLGLGA